MKSAGRLGYVVVSAAALICACSPKVFYKSAWQSSPVIADGRLNEWPHPLKYYDAVSKCTFSISNDSHNLYMCLEATDREVINGLVQDGLRIWLDTTGKKKQVTGILCPLPQVNAAPQHGNPRRGRGWAPAGYNPGRQAALSPNRDTGRKQSLRTRFLESAKRIHVTGFSTVANGILNLPDTASGINIGVSWDEPNDLVYEISIPLNTFYHTLVRPADTLKKIGITFNFTAVPRIDTSGRRQENSGVGFSPGIGFGFGGFGGFGFGPMGMMDDYGWGGEGSAVPQPRNETIWLPVHLTERY